MKAKTLDDYMPSKARGGTKCLTCSLPGSLRSQVERLRAEGRSFMAISQGLEAMASESEESIYPISDAALRNHFARGHHRVDQ